jgi:hypothetical protein
MILLLRQKTATQKEKVVTKLENKYWVFCWDNYYPSGGLLDLVGKFASIEEAVKTLQDKQIKKTMWNGVEFIPWGDWKWGFECYQILDIQTQEILYSNVESEDELIGEDLMDNKYLKHNQT